MIKSLFLSLAVVTAAMYTPEVPTDDYGSSGALGDTINLPIRVGGTGLDTSTTIVAMRADPTGADSLYGLFHQAHYDVNDWPGKMMFNPSNLSDLSLQNRRDDAADVRFRVNSGSWSSWMTDWNDNPNVNIRWRERGYPGANGFGGRYHLVRAAFALPTPVPANGLLEVEFRFNGTEGLRSKYRVVDVDLYSSSAGFGISQLASTKLMQNPESWTPYSALPDSIAAGLAAFIARNTLTDFTNGAGNGVPAAIRASCADCHTTNGMDLKLFNYSNEEIVERSVYHGTSVATGRNIASYIRSIDLNIPDHDYDADGVIEPNEQNRETLIDCHPWNPTFQPGPGIDRLPILYWTCGAGFANILEMDYQMAEDYATNGGQVPFTGYHADSIAALYGRPGGVDYRYAINRRQIRVAHMLTTWNQWLPRIAPIDMSVNISDYTNSCSQWDSWCNRTGDQGRADNSYGVYNSRYSQDWMKLERVSNQRRAYRGESGLGAGMDNLLGEPLNIPNIKPLYNNPGLWHQIYAQSRRMTAGVHLWYRMHTITWPWLNEYGQRQTAAEISNDLYCNIANGPSSGGRTYQFLWPNGTIRLGPTAPGTEASTNYSNTNVSSSLNGSFSNRVNCAEYRSWGTHMGDWTIFAMSNHIHGRDERPSATGWGYPAEHAPHTTDDLNEYYGSIWYETSGILEGANRQTGPGGPNDWNYTHPHINGVENLSGVGSDQMRAIVNGMQMYQVMQGPERSFGSDHGGSPGLGKGWNPHHAMQQRSFYMLTSGGMPTFTLFSNHLGNLAANRILGGSYLAWVSEAERYNRALVDATPSVRGTDYGDIEPANTTFSGGGASPHDVHAPGAWIYNSAGYLNATNAPDYIRDRVARYGASLFNTPSGFSAYFCDPCVDDGSGGGGEANQIPTAQITYPAQGQVNVPLPHTLTLSHDDVDGTVVGVEWERVTDLGNWNQICLSATPANPNCEITTGPVMGTYFIVRSRVLDDDGAHSLWHQINYDGVGVDTENPTIPTNARVTNATSTSLEVTWSPSTDNSSSVSYTVSYKRTVDPSYTTAVSNHTGISYNITGLTPYTQYDITVRAFDPTGNSSDAARIEGKTLLEDVVWSGSGVVLQNSREEELVTLSSENGGRLWGNNFGGVVGCTPISGDFSAYTTLRSQDATDLYSGAGLVASTGLTGAAAMQGIMSQFQGTRAIAITKKVNKSPNRVGSLPISLPATFRLVRTGNTIVYSVAIGLGGFTTIATEAVEGNPTYACLVGSGRTASFSFIFSKPVVIP